MAKSRCWISGWPRPMREDGAPNAPDASHSPTLTKAGSESGVILGTAAYMSPEQARGKPVDKRADIWAFGVVLFETLAGQRLFHGETTSDTLAAILKADPDWKQLPAETPPRIRELLRRCLTRDPKQRLRDVGEARVAIGQITQDDNDAQANRRRPSRVGIAGALVSAIALLVGLVVGFFGRGPTSVAPRWTGERLGGSTAAYGPRISPDGRMVAFQAIVDGVSQVAVLKPESGNWSVLTRDRSRGVVMELSWSPDGSHIFFDRYLGVPAGIFSVPVLGGEERLVLEDAMGPQSLPDGSLLVTRLNAERRFQIHRFWPATNRLEPLRAFPSQAFLNPPLRASPDGREAVFLGRLDTPQTSTREDVWALDLNSGRTRLLAQGPFRVFDRQDLGFPLAVDPNDGSVLIDLPVGDVHRIVSIPRDGSGRIDARMVLTQKAWFLDIGQDAAYYTDQVYRAGDLAQVSTTGATFERMAVSDAIDVGPGDALPVPDGRVLLASSLAGRARLLVGRRGAPLVPLVETREETDAPLALLPDDEVAFLARTGAGPRGVVASLADGRIKRRLAGPHGPINALAAAPDGKALYYASDGVVWSVPATDGPPRKVHAGDSMAAHPNGRELIVQLNEPQEIRLVRVSLTGGPDERIRFRDNGLRLTPNELSPNAIASDGRILVSVAPRASWFWPAGILDPKRQTLELVPNQPEADVVSTNWTSDGRIFMLSVPLRSTLWRFRKEP